MKIRELLREDKNSAQAWIDKVYAQYPDWPYGQADKVMVWGEGEDQQFAAFKLKPGAKDDTVEIDWIMAGPEQRKGVGSRAIKELQRQAQAAGIKLTLFPWGHGKISQSSLTKLYKRHGFKPIAKGAKPMQWEPDLNEPISEDNNNSLVDEFWRINKGRIKSMTKRDNCGPTALAFVDFLKSKGIQSQREGGYFIADKPVHDFWDFYREQHQAMKQQGLDPKSDEDRVKYMIDNHLEDEQRKIPHYWVVVDGKKVDPVGQFQLVNSGLAKDLNPSRYVSTGKT